MSGSRHGQYWPWSILALAILALAILGYGFGQYWPCTTAPVTPVHPVPGTTAPPVPHYPGHHPTHYPYPPPLLMYAHPPRPCQTLFTRLLLVWSAVAKPGIINTGFDKTGNLNTVIDKTAIWDPVFCLGVSLFWMVFVHFCINSMKTGFINGFVNN